MNNELETVMQCHAELVLKTRNALVGIGYPPQSIVEERGIAFNGGKKFVADLLVLGKDDKSVVAVFEIKTGIQGLGQTFARGKRSLAYANSRFPCFVVTQRDGNCVIASAKDTVPNWVNLFDKDAMLRLLGDYTVNSNNRVDAEQKKSDDGVRKEGRIYALVIGGVGIAMTLLGGGLEAAGIWLSWRPYALCMTVLVLCSAFAGVCIHVRYGDFGFSFFSPGADYRRSQAEKELQE